MTTLLAKPIEFRPHIKLPVVAHCTDLRINVDFHHCPHLWSPADAISQFNEYLASLIASQLEFQFPMVFSIIARNRFKSQETDIGPISYSLACSSALIPITIQLIAGERTATTVCQLLRPNRRTSRINFKILRQPSD
ncbi:hypothetical protein ZYGR_0AZ00130 [Zygosaccharomyces rouxii]|uniref:Uncharacterized protein n=1 Tax=Zygosaccharomyces rouxii TaxID=4956 RepID=A0A1Q3AJS5_ZYGRO|nr:hypothetical protein ZYGR_0AZ00130 [Zygosaccharomyces rouxii]